MSAQLPADIHANTILVPLPDGHSLETDIYEVPHGTASQPASQRVAILCHPWSWLGGCKDDPVLVSLAVVLNTTLGMHVFVPNTRSVGNSTGRASFSGKSEASDLEELTRWCVTKIGNVECVVIIGYSHGSLLASCHPVLPAPIQTYHVLLSYPVSPLPLLTFFHASTYRERLGQLVKNPCARVLILYGDKDQFTAADNFELWVDALKKATATTSSAPETAPSAELDVKMVSGADHFWRGRFNAAMSEAILGWLTQHEQRRTAAA